MENHHSLIFIAFLVYSLCCLVINAVLSFSMGKSTINIITLWLWLTVRHGKSPFFIGKPSISIGHLYHGYVMLNYQRTSDITRSTRHFFLGIHPDKKAVNIDSIKSSWMGESDLLLWGKSTETVINQWEGPTWLGEQIKIWVVQILRIPQSNMAFLEIQIRKARTKWMFFFAGNIIERNGITCPASHVWWHQMSHDVWDRRKAPISKS